MYLRCFQNCGVTMTVNAQMTEIETLPKIHEHEDGKEEI